MRPRYRSTRATACSCSYLPRGASASHSVAGSIATGKRSRCDLMLRLGAYHSDADKLTHRLYDPKTPLLTTARSALGRKSSTHMATWHGWNRARDGVSTFTPRANP